MDHHNMVPGIQILNYVIKIKRVVSQNRLKFQSVMTITFKASLIQETIGTMSSSLFLITDSNQLKV
jgi:hypothetical protein